MTEPEKPETPKPSTRTALQRTADLARMIVAVPKREANVAAENDR